MSRDWMDRAACVGADTDLFFTDDPAVALYYCNQCEVRAACLADALGDRDYGGWGVRGGLTPNQRTRLRHQAQA